jgi:hypothetical protein
VTDAATRRAEASFKRLVEHYANDPAVAPPSVGKGGKFGESALKVDGARFRPPTPLAVQSSGNGASGAA